MPPLPAALVVAHPGHELRLHRWLEVARPLVFVLTDGSGSGRSRIGSTLDILASTGCTAGSIMGALTDREIYRMMLDGDIDPVAEMTIEVAQSVIARGIRSVVADAFELYNPTHDLCSVMARLASERAGVMPYEYSVTAAPGGEGELLRLDDAAIARKLAAAHRYEGLREEVDGLVSRIGADALTRELLKPVDTALPLTSGGGKPFYETYGEQRVAEGHYKTVIRYETHFRPFVQKLTAAVQGAPAAAAHRAWR